TQVHLRQWQRPLSQGLWRYGGDDWHIDAERAEHERRFHSQCSMHKCLFEAAKAVEGSRRANERYSTPAITIKRERAKGYLSNQGLTRTPDGRSNLRWEWAKGRTVIWRRALPARTINKPWPLAHR